MLVSISKRDDAKDQLLISVTCCLKDVLPASLP